MRGIMGGKNKNMADKAESFGTPATRISGTD